MILNKSIEQWQKEFPKLKSMMEYNEILWVNDNQLPAENVLLELMLNEDDILDAEARLKRFAPYIAHVFPEAADHAGIIESPLTELTQIQDSLKDITGKEINGSFYLKEDNKLPISGSVKARGGIYEVLAFAEKLALDARLITEDDGDYKKFADDEFKTHFSKYSLVCGSTGNLGLSIGIMGAELGFNVVIHMSDDARQWKKDMLRSKGVTVVEHSDDYSKAVARGREETAGDPKSYFIDDENSKTLFLGYAVAAIRLKAQLQAENININAEHPLNVYLPCGVGGGPGGIAFGLKVIFADAVNCYFAEPTHSPCMTIGMMTNCHDKISVQDFGIDNITAADGLAVGRASGFVGELLENLISGSYTVSDENLFKMLAVMDSEENIKLEPSALAGVIGPAVVNTNGVHIAWSTGGDMVPEDVYQEYYFKGKELI